MVYSLVQIYIYAWYVFERNACTAREVGASLKGESKSAKGEG